MCNSRAILIVDLYGSCKALAQNAVNRGYKVYCLLSGAEKTFQLSNEEKNAYIQENTEGFTVVPTNHLENPLFQEDGAPSQELLDYLESYHFAAIIPGSEIGVTAAEELAHALHLPTNKKKMLVARRNKFEMQEALRQAGLRSIQQKRIHALQEAIAFFDEQNNKPVVLKPIQGAGSEHVYICTSREEITSCFHKLVQSKTFYGDPNTTVLIQQYIDGTEYVCNFASREGKHVLLDYLQYNKIELLDASTGSWIPVYDAVLLKKQIPHTVLTYAQSVLNALGITQGASHMEIKIDKDGPILIEVGARMMGHLPTFVQLHKALGYNPSDKVLDSYLDTVAFNKFAQTPYNPPHSFLYFAFKSTQTVHIQTLTAKTTLPLVPSLASYNLEILEKTGVVPAVTNLMTIAGEAILYANTDEAVLRDYTTLKLLETSCSNLLWLPQGTKLSSFDKKVLASLKESGKIDTNLITTITKEGPICVLEKTNIGTTFEQQAQKFPHNSAITDYYQNEVGKLVVQHLSYKHLDELTNRAAVALMRLGIKAGDCVAICMNKSIPRSIALLAILKAGATATILPFDAPHNRFLEQFKKTEAALLITQKAILDSFDSNIVSVSLDKLLLKENYQPEELEFCKEQRKNPIAMKAFTTGTTGKPKVAYLFHQALLNTANYYQKGGGGIFETCGFGPKLTKAVTAKESFVAWPAELLVSLVSGVSVSFIHPQDCVNPVQFISRARMLNVNLLWSAPAFVTSLLKQTLPEMLKLIECGGEGVVIRSHPKRPIIHLYGMTELFGAAAINYINAPNIRGDIGEPIQNTRFYLLDDTMQPVKRGEIGQICISGIGLGDIAGPLRQEGILPNPLYCSFTDKPLFQKMICTGDYAKLDSEGKLIYEGRKDSQVNINGQRISLQEIESVLDTIKILQEHIIVPQKITKTSTQLIAYVVADEQLDTHVIKEKIAQQLPPYYVPSQIVQLAKLPRNRHDKVSIKDLPLPNVIVEQSTIPTGDTSKEPPLFAQLSHILGSSITEQNAHTSFLDLGFDSFMLHEVLAALGVQYPSLLLTYSDLHTHDTPHKLQIHIETCQNLATNPQINNDKTLNAAAISKTTTSYSDSAQQPLQEDDKTNRTDTLKKTQLNHETMKQLKVLPSTQAVLLDEMIAPQASTKYTLSFMLPVHGVSLNHIRAFLSALITTQPALRSSFSFSGKDFEQHVSPVSPIAQAIMADIKVHTFRNQRDVLDFAQHNIPVFCIFKAPLFSCSVLTLNLQQIPTDNEEQIFGYLLFFAHHSIIDGSSIALIADMAKRYFLTASPTLADETKSFYDTFNYYQKYIHDKKYQEDKNYWAHYLENVASFKLTQNRKEHEGNISVVSDAHTLAYKNFLVELSPDVYKKLKAACKQGGYSIAAALLNAFFVSLSHELQVTKVSVVSPFNTRPTSSSELVIGMFAQTLPISYEVTNRNTNPASHAKALKHLNTTLQNHALHQWGFSGTDTTILKNIDVMWNYLHIPSENKLRTINMAETQKHLMVTAKNTGDKICFSATYNAAVIQDETVQAIMNSLLKNLESSTNKKPASYIAASKLRQSSNALSSTSSKKFYEHLVATFSQYAKRTALKWYDAQHVLQKMTYQELEQNVEAQAHHIKQAQAEYGINSHYPLIISQTEYHQVLISFLATFKLGIPALYVSPSQDEGYKKNIATTISAPLILTDNGIEHGSTTLVSIDELYFGQTSVPLILLATSGSTGKPKIIPLKMSSLMNECREEKTAYSLTQSDVVASFSNPSFDMFYLTLLPALFSGATCLVYSIDGQTTLDMIHESLQTNNATYAFMTTKLGEAYMEAFPTSHVAQLVVAGEKLRYKPKTSYAVYNAYGPAEAGIVTRLKLEPHKTYTAQEISLGKPCNNMRVYLIRNRKSLALCTPGEKGEIALSGPQLIDGYLEDIQTRAFIKNPFSQKPMYRKLYLTSDLGYFEENENLIFCGRKDSQIKINGVRINPLFIEDMALSLSYITHAAAITPKIHGTHRLILFVTSKSQKNEKELRTELKHLLPQHLLPKRIIVLDTLPLTQTGKIDRKKLEQDFIATNKQSAHAKPMVREQGFTPHDTLYQQVIKSYAKLFNMESHELNEDSNFFDLGGNSLLALMLSHSLKAESNINLSPASILTYPLLGKQVEHLQQVLQPSLLIKLTQHDTKRNLILIHSGNTGAEAYKKLANKLEGSFSVWCIEPYNRENLNKPLRTIEELAAYYLQLLEREGFSSQSTILAGWSFGSLVAYEMVLQAQKQGESFRQLFLFDPVLPQTPEEKSLYRSLYEGETFLRYLKSSPLFEQARKKGLLKTLFQHGEMVTQAILAYNFKPLMQPTILFKAEKGEAHELFATDCFEKQEHVTTVSLATTHDDLLVEEEALNQIAQVIKNL